MYKYLAFLIQFAMKFKKIIAICTITLIGFISKVSAVTVRTLSKTKNTADNDLTQIDGSRSILDIISFINNYLWFAIWFVCFLFMIINGYKLIMDTWDEKQSPTKWLLWSIIWIVICLLAYIIVNLAVKLFA